MNVSGSEKKKYISLRKREEWRPWWYRKKKLLVREREERRPGETEKKNY